MLVVGPGAVEVPVEATGVSIRFRTASPIRGLNVSSGTGTDGLGSGSEGAVNVKFHVAIGRVGPRGWSCQ